ncbi:MAG: glutaminyl-peptide cyclotransferase [Actinomycetes bacterium]
MLSGCGGSSSCPGGPASPRRLVPTVLRVIPHASDAFTQGLVVADGKIYESTGLEGRSTIRILDLQTGAELARTKLPKPAFGEGLTIDARGRLVQLTWKDGTAYRWDRRTLQPLGTVSYDGEGWGLTTLRNGQLLMSDGSNRLTTRRAADFTEVRSVEVRRPSGPTDRLNELEADGKVVWANRWRTSQIFRIDVRCGWVKGVVDASGLTEAARVQAGANGDPVDVLNGIANVPGTNHFLLTGKCGLFIFEVQFHPP